jgi:hypothetical protein
LTSLDVSANTKIEELYCADNRLKDLDVTQNPALRMLHCSDNFITSPEYVFGWEQLGLTINRPSSTGSGTFRFYHQKTPEEGDGQPTKKPPGHHSVSFRALNQEYLLGYVQYVKDGDPINWTEVYSNYPDANAYLAIWFDEVKGKIMWDNDAPITNDTILFPIYVDHPVRVVGATVVSFSETLHTGVLAFVVEASLSDGTSNNITHTERIIAANRGSRIFTYSDYTVYVSWDSERVITRCEALLSS